ncbi:MAG: Helix-turn-helix domain [Pseudomonadota bacterium]|jgi:transcriptional regulator with XRE-family HTH domain
MIGKKLSDRRMALGLEIADVSRLSGMTPRQITAIERAEYQHFNSDQELSRLLKLYAKKLDLDLGDSDLGRFLPHTEAAPPPMEREVMIPAFLLKQPLEK